MTSTIQTKLFSSYNTSIQHDSKVNKPCSLVTLKSLFCMALLWPSKTAALTIHPSQPTPLQPIGRPYEKAVSELPPIQKLPIFLHPGETITTQVKVNGAAFIQPSEWHDSELSIEILGRSPIFSPYSLTDFINVTDFLVDHHQQFSWTTSSGNRQTGVLTNDGLFTWNDCSKHPEEIYRSVASSWNTYAWASDRALTHADNTCTEFARFTKDSAYEDALWLTSDNGILAIQGLQSISMYSINRLFGAKFLIEARLQTINVTLDKSVRNIALGNGFLAYHAANIESSYSCSL